MIFLIIKDVERIDLLSRKSSSSVGYLSTCAYAILSDIQLPSGLEERSEPGLGPCAFVRQLLQTITGAHLDQCFIPMDPCFATLKKGHQGVDSHTKRMGIKI